MCECMCTCHSMCAEGRGQLANDQFSPTICGFARTPIQVIKDLLHAESSSCLCIPSYKCSLIVKCYSDYSYLSNVLRRLYIVTVIYI